MHDLYTILNKVLSFDPGDRGLLRHIPAADWDKAAHMLKQARSVLIVTGFPILNAGIGENDGPIGALSLAYALHKSGRRAAILTDPLSDKLALACREALALSDCPILSVPLDASAQAVADMAKTACPDLVISIERPGKTGDGTFRNMRALDISHMTADTDGLLDLGLPAICIGDGGNELGMGNFAAIIEQHVNHGTEICAQKTCDLPIAAGISNWGGWALAALLSAAKGRDYMTTAAQEQAMLDAIAHAGGVDGVKGCVANSVDGLERGGIDEVFLPIRKSLENILSRITD